MKKYIRLLRFKNYIKNFLIFFPFIFSGTFMNLDDSYITMLIGFAAFCCMSSAVYIINDIMDVEKDRLHPKKSKRPIASGEVKISAAIILAIVLSAISIISGICLHNYMAVVLLIAYLILNIAYSSFLKNQPIIDIAVLSLFFIIRVYFGGVLVNVPISIYLYLTTMSVAFMMGANKRQKEKISSEECRDTLKLYPDGFLPKIAQTSMGLGIVFYALWVIGDTNILINTSAARISIFFVVVILMYYQYIIDKSEDGNPVDIIFANPSIILLASLYVALMVFGFVL